MKIISSKDLIPYKQACQKMEKLRQSIIENNKTQDYIWFLEHFHVFTLGKSGSADDILEPYIPVYPNNRGGKVIYHGPGQLIIYCICDLKNYKKDISFFIHLLEAWVIAVLTHCGIKGQRKDQRGIWVGNRKIAFIGLHIHKWITTHGIAFNYAPVLSYFQNIRPCGKEQEVTSLKELGVQTTRFEIEEIFKYHLNVLNR